MHDAKGYALKEPCCSLEREMLNTTGAWRVLLEKHTHLEIKSALGIPVLQMGTVLGFFWCCFSIITPPMVR